MNELGKGRKFYIGMNHKDADDQDGDRAQLDVGGKVVARFQYQPDRKNGCHQTVDAHEEGDLMRSESKRSSKSTLSYPASGNHAADQKDDTEDAWASDRYLPGMAFEHPPSHDDGDGNRHADGEDAPRAIRKRVDHYNAEAGERHQKNKEHGDHRHQTGEGTDFGAGNIGDRAAAMTHRSHKHGKILHAASQNGADQQPKEARRKPELCRQSGPHQRSCSRDGGEVMSEEHPSRRSDVVMPVRVSVRGSRAASARAFAAMNAL